MNLTIYLGLILWCNRPCSKRKEKEPNGLMLVFESLSATKVLSHDRGAQGFAFGFSILDPICFLPILLTAE
jgi:hypothetical protein